MDIQHEEILSNYDIGLIKETGFLESGFQSDNIYVSTDRGTFVLKQIKGGDPELVNNIMHVNEYLSIKGIKTAYPIRTKDNQLLIVQSDNVFSLQKFIEGDPKKREDDIFPMLSFLGSNIGQIHQALAELDSHPIPSFNHRFGTDCIRSLKNLAEKYMPGDEFVQHQYASWLKEIPSVPLEKLTKCIVNGDLQPWMFFFKDEKFTGIIDFGSSSYNFALFDVATMMMYCGLFKPDRFEYYKDFIKGYLGKGPISIRELSFLRFFIKTRFLIQVLYFSLRLMKNILQGVDSKKDNIKGFEEGKDFLRIIDSIPPNRFLIQRSFFRG